MPYKSVELHKVSHSYERGALAPVQALKNVSLTIEAGEFVAVVGVSGSGKSTLAGHLNGTLVPGSGRVLIHGRDTRNRKVRSRLWRDVGLVLQNPERQLFEATVFDDVAFGPKNLGLSPVEIERAVVSALDVVGLDVRDVGGRSPFNLSGGEKRRVAIAGTLALSPSILVLDEPLSGLDPPGRRELLEQLVSLHRRRGTAVILITHNMDDAARAANRIMSMERGSIRADGGPEKVFLSPGLREGPEVPFAVRVLRRLRENGHPVGEALVLEDAAEEIIKSYHIRNRGGINV